MSDVASPALQGQLSEQYLQRFGGISRLYGPQALQRFHQAHVCVIGIGGVGSWVAEALARSGIGRITLIDMDDICVTNTNRQIHALEGTVGEQKIEAMAARLKGINPEIQVDCIDDFIDADNQAEYLGTRQEPRYDYVVDAIDSIKAKAALLAYCNRNKLKVITIGGAGGQIDPTQIAVSDLARTIQDPLASKLRSELRRNYNFSKNTKRKFGIDCVYSTEQLIYPQSDGSVCNAKHFEGSTRMDCSTGFGAATQVTATFGFVAVSRVLKKLAG